MIHQVLPVGMLTSYIRELFENDELLADVWVEGEISNLFAARSGHVYFTLRDGECQIKCALFRSYALRQPRLPAAGEQAAVHGRVSVYERDGAYQLYVDAVQPAGTGLLALQFELLRQWLEAEGLFDSARKRPLPRAPRCIGVVTSPDGAVWHDIQQVLRRRYPLTELVLAPAPVQGEGAAEGLVAALAAIQHERRVEVVIIARGGGSAEDLWCFNDERLIRAVFACRVPVVSAVGHETDWTLLDYVADLRAPTPSAAAELCSPSIDDLGDRLAGLRSSLTRHSAGVIAEGRTGIAHLRRHLDRNSPAATLALTRPRVIDLGARVAGAGAAAQAERRSSVASVWAHGCAAQRDRVAERRRRVIGQAAVTRALNPERVLARGYAVLTLEGARWPLLDAGAVPAGTSVRARLAAGELVARVSPPASSSPTHPGAVRAD